MEVKKELQLASAYDDVIIGYDIYEPRAADNKKIILQILHGMAEHKNRYADFASFLANHGITVVVSSHRGHLGSARMEDYGYMGKNGLEHAKEDGYKLTQLIKQSYPDYKYYLMGHSMGSLIARRYFQTYNNELDGLIICGCPAYNNAAPIAKMLAKLCIMLQGGHYPSSLLDKLSFGTYNKRFEKRTKFDWLSENQANVDNYIADKGCGFLFTTQSFHDLTDAMITVYSDYPASFKNQKCPVLFVAGNDDPCGNYGKGVKEAVEHMQRQNVEQVSLILYPKMRHEILNETNKNIVYEDILRFISN